MILSATTMGINARFQLATCLGDDGNTYPAEVFYSAPYKLTNYFRLDDGGIEYIVMNASAGIMAHDRYQMKIEVAAATSLTISSQSFEKIHRMEHGDACREVKIILQTGSLLKYLPLPTIPYQASAFRGTTQIDLADASSKLFYLDVIGSGRHARGERYQYKSFQSSTEVRLAGKLIFRDNNCFIPNLAMPTQLGVLENYEYLANLLIYGFKLNPAMMDGLNEQLRISNLDAAISELHGAGYLVRILANRAEDIYALIKEIERLI